MRMDSINFGTPDNTWTQYGLSELPIVVNTHDTAKKAIMRNGELITIVSDRYQLLPNEEAVKVAEKVAAAAGLVPFDQFTGDWICKFHGKDHITTYGDKNAKVHAMYALNEPYYVGGDKMYMGIGIHNSIDGSKAFGVGAFTFRAACSNMVIVAGKKNWSFYHGAADHAKTLEYVQKRHTKGLDPREAKLSITIAEVVDYAKGIKAAYDDMAVTKVTEKLLEKIKASRIPKKVLPEWVTAEEINVEEKTITEWELYNDITEQVWHNPETDFGTKERIYSRLHAVMPVTPRRA